MANRFRMAIKNTGGEILAAGKQDELITSNDDENFSEFIEAKNIEDNAIDFSREKDENIISFNKNIYFNKEFMLISTFLKEKVGNYIFELRINKLKEIINTLIEQEGSGKSILLTDYKANMVNWIEAIKIAVPESIKSLITFTIKANKVSDEYEDCEIHNSTKDKNTKTIDKETSVEFYVFDFTKTIRNQVSTHTQYSELVQIGFLNNDPRFYEFKSFFDELEYKELDVNIDKCLILYYFTLTGIEHLDYTSIQEALEFAEKYCDLSVCKKLFEKATVTLNLNKEMANLIIKFMLKVSKALGEKEYYIKTYKFMFEYLQKLLISSKDNNLAPIYEFYYEVDKLNENDFVTDDETITKLSEYASNSDTKFASFYLTIILGILNIKKSTWKFNQMYISFIEKAMNFLIEDFEAVKAVIDCVGDNIEYKSNLIIIYYNLTKDDELKNKQILEFYSEKEKEYGQGAKDIRRFMTRIPEGSMLVFDEFKQNLTNSTNKIKFFWDYKTNVFDKISVYKEEHLSSAMEVYLKTIKNESFYNDEWTKVLNLISNNQITLQDEVLIYFIEDYENRVPLVGADIVTQVNLKDISRIRKTRNIVTSNANALMIEFGRNIKNAKTTDQISHIINLKFPQVKSVSKEKLEEFFEWSLDLLIGNANSEKNHLFGFYNKILEELKEDNKDFALMVLNTESLARFKVSLDKKNIKKVVFYLQITLGLLIKRGTTWNTEGEIEAFIKYCIGILSNSKELIEYCLIELVDHVEYYAQVFSIYAFAVHSSEIFLPLFLKKADKQGKDWSQKVRNRLDECENGDLVLFEEFKFKLGVAPNKSEFFWDHLNNVFGELSNYVDTKLEDTFEEYLLQIEKNANYAEECLNILKFLIDNKLNVKKGILTKIICEFEKTISITPPIGELETLIDMIAIYKSENGLVTVPSITEIANFTFKLERLDNSEEIIDLLEKATLNLKGLEKEKYSKYIEWCFNIISKNLNMMEQVDLLKKTFCVDELKDIYSKLYNGIIIKLLTSETENLSKEQLQALIMKHSDVLEIAAQLMIQYYKKCLESEDKSTAISLFVKLVNDSKSFSFKKTNLEILRYFSGLENGNELIFEEYKYKLEVEKNKVKFFATYWFGLADKFKEYKKNYYVKTLECYLSLIKNNNNYPEVCYELLEGLMEDNLEISKDILTEIVTAAEKLILIASPTLEQNEIIFKISGAKTKWNIVISPDIIACINMGSTIDGLENLGEIRKVINECKIDLRNIDYSRYEEWLYWCLPNVKYAATSWQIHAAITKAFCADSLKNIFFTTYIGVLGDELTKNSSKWVEIFGQFMVFFMSNKDKFGEETYAQARANVINVLTRCTNTNIFDLDNVIISEYMNIENNQEVAIEWIQIQKRFTPATRQEKGFFSKVFKK